MMRDTCLADPTLVLNKNWLPIQVCSVRRAVTMLFKGLARVVEPEDYSLYDFESWSDLVISNGEPYLQGVSRRIRIPEVIVLHGCDRFRRPQVVFTRRNLFAGMAIAVSIAAVNSRPRTCRLTTLFPGALAGSAAGAIAL